jgi:hypothetical protein
MKSSGLLKIKKINIMQKRTYTEAVELTVNWWAEKSFETPLNQNNGDNSSNGGMAFMLMNMASMFAQDENTPDKIEKFKTELTKLLIDVEGQGKYYNELSVDYDPNKLLYEACKLSGVSSRCLPCKTFTFINSENEVEGRYQYGGEWFKL